MTWVILPGMDGTGELGEPFVKQLPKEDVGVVVRYPRERVLARKDLLAVAEEALPLVGDYIIVGESFSGPFAIEIAARNPRRLKGVVLVSTFARNPLGPMMSFLARVFGGVAMRVRPPAWVARKFLVGYGATEEQVAVALGAIGSVRGAVLASRLRMVLHCDVKNYPGAIKAPTIVVAAKGDRLVRRRCAEEMAEKIAGAKLVWVDGPHTLLLMRARQVFEAVSGLR